MGGERAHRAHERRPLPLAGARAALLSTPSATVAGLIGRCLVGLGARRSFRVEAAGLPALPGLVDHVVNEAASAVALADADGRLGAGPGVALLGGRILRLGSQPGAEVAAVRVDDASVLPGLLAGWTFGSVHGCLEVVLEVDLDAPAPDDAKPVVMEHDSSELLTLSPSLAAFDALVLAGPGVVREGCVEGLRAFAAQAGCGVINTWGAKGVFVWDSPHHLGTAGLQSRDFDLAGFGEAELIVAVGLDPLESPSARWAHGQVLEVDPWQLATLAWGWEPVARAPERPPLYRELSAALADHYASESVPLSPARAAADLAACRPEGGLVAADPGPAGLWVARAFPTTEPGSVVVPAAFCRGFAAAAAVVAGLDGRPAIAVTTEPVDESTAQLIRLAERWKVPLTVGVWGAASSLGSAAAHREALQLALASPGIDLVPVPVDFAQTRVLVEVAGEVVAWLG